MSLPDELLKQLERSYKAVHDALTAVEKDQDWRPEPDEWSYRFIAGHMAQVELDCHLNRVWRIAAGEKPHYNYYSNAGWDFSHYEISEWLYLWRGRRQELLEFVRSLTPEQLAYSGTHELFGTITVQDVLQIAYEHDQEHLVHLLELKKISSPPLLSNL